MRQAHQLLLLSAFMDIAAAQQYSSYITAVIYGQTVSWIYTPLSSYPAPTAPASSSADAEPTSIEAPSSLVSAAISAASSTPATSQQPVTVSVRETTIVTTPAPRSSQATSQRNGGGPGAATSAARSQVSSRASNAGTAAGAAASETAGTAAVSQNRSNSDGGLCTGAIVGIAVGVGVLALLLLLGLLFFCLRRRKQRKQKVDASSASSFNEEPKPAPMAMAPSDTSLMNDDYPPANSHAREPTLPNVGELPGSGSGAPVLPPVAAASSGNNNRNPFMDPSEPITNAVPVHSSSEAAATVASQGANRPWKPSAPTPRYYEPSRQSDSANSMAGFDFGIGNQNRMPESNRQSIPRRPVGGNGY